MRGYVALTAEVKDLDVYKGFETLRLYSFGTHTAKHYFCGQCGIHTHHQRRSNPNHAGINAACLAGLSPFDFEVVPVIDGENHPRDVGPGAIAAQVGVLTYAPDFQPRSSRDLPGGQG